MFAVYTKVNFKILVKCPKKSKQLDTLAAEIREYKAGLAALGLDPSATSKLDGFASQVENYAAEVKDSETTIKAESVAELPVGKIGELRGTTPDPNLNQVPDAQTQLDSQKAADAANSTNATAPATDAKATPVSKADAEKTGK